MSARKLANLLTEIRNCSVCEPHLLLGANPVLRAQQSAKVLIIGQAPGTKVHKTGIPWNDPSGDKLREWMSVDKDTFYDESKIAIIPMGFCYPGKGKSGDLPPREECAPLWHTKLLDLLPNIKLTLLFGQYAQHYYLNTQKQTLTQTVKNWKNYTPKLAPSIGTGLTGTCFPMPHPSPRNRLWLKKNSWFERDVVPHLQRVVRRTLT